MLLVKYRQSPRVRNNPDYLLSKGCNAEDKLIIKHGLQAVKPIMINEYIQSQNGWSGQQ